MTGHYCTGDDRCRRCDALIAYAELVRDETPLATDIEHATRRAEQRFEDQVYGEDRAAAATRREVRDRERDDARRAARWLMGETA